MNITKLILPLAVVASIANAQPISIPGSQFPVTNTLQSWFRFMMIDTNGHASANSYTRSNVTITPPNLYNQVALALQANGTVPFISLATFGAVGDGTTDDTTAMQNWANYICSTNCLGLLPPAQNEYKITSEIVFTNTARIVPGGSGTVFAGSAFSPTHCRVNQHTAGANGWVFNNYNDNITIDGVFITNSAANNYQNIDSSGFMFTGAVGSHASRITQCGAANFGRGLFSVDLAASTIISSAFQNNSIGIEVTNILNTGNYPTAITSCILSGNYITQVRCSGTNVPFLVQGCILTPLLNPANAIESYARSCTLIEDQILPGTAANLINQTGGTISIINCPILFNGSAGFYPIVATNANVFMTGFMTLSNSLDGSTVYLFGSGCRIRTFPDLQYTQNDGSGTLSTNYTSDLPTLIGAYELGNNVVIWASNKVVYGSSSTKTNLITNLQ